MEEAELRISEAEGKISVEKKLALIQKEEERIADELAEASIDAKRPQATFGKVAFEAEIFLFDSIGYQGCIIKGEETHQTDVGSLDLIYHTQYSKSNEREKERAGRRAIAR